VKMGSLFSGYGGLDLAVSHFFGAETLWYSEIEPAACQILAANYPGVPNLGDVTEVDWANVPPVDVLVGGYPCQPFSQAGKREGKNDERHLWPFVGSAISTLRPGMVVLENVQGHISLGLANVVGDLAGMGYDARWGVVRASDAGAPHERSRVFIVAYPFSDSDGPRWMQHGGTIPTEPKHYPAKYVSDVATDWGKYANAVEGWESITRSAPPPTIPGVKGKPRLSPAFVEWMMGLPDGWVSGHGLSPAKALQALGNGVCPQQAFLALQLLIGGKL